MQLYTRGGLDWTDRFGKAVPQHSILPADQAILDGDIVESGCIGFSTREPI